MCRLTHHKGCSLERARPRVKEIHLLIFQCPLEEQGPLGLSPGVEELAGTIFYPFLYLASANRHNIPPCSPTPC